MWNNPEGTGEANRLDGEARQPNLNPTVPLTSQEQATPRGDLQGVFTLADGVRATSPRQ